MWQKLLPIATFIYMILYIHEKKNKTGRARPRATSTLLVSDWFCSMTYCFYFIGSFGIQITAICSFIYNSNYWDYFLKKYSSITHSFLC